MGGQPTAPSPCQPATPGGTPTLPSLGSARLRLLTPGSLRSDEPGGRRACLVIEPPDTQTASPSPAVSSLHTQRLIRCQLKSGPQRSPSTGGWRSGPRRRAGHTGLWRSVRSPSLRALWGESQDRRRAGQLLTPGLAAMPPDTAQAHGDSDMRPRAPCSPPAGQEAPVAVGGGGTVGVAAGTPGEVSLLLKATPLPTAGTRLAIPRSTGSLTRGARGLLETRIPRPHGMAHGRL